MKRVLGAVLALFLFTATPLLANWPAAAKKVQNSLVQLYAQRLNGVGNCTAFSINFPKGYYLTASHCIQGATAVELDRELAKIAFEDPDLDLAVLEGHSRRVALKPAKRLPRQGESVGAMGYGHNLQFPILVQGNVAAPAIEIPIPPYSLQPYFVVSESFIRGMSGGPIFNWDGEVVSIVQMGDPSDHLGVGRPLPVIMGATSRFWER